jgi:hypothetical protein
MFSIQTDPSLIKYDYCNNTLAFYPELARIERIFPANLEKMRQFINNRLPKNKYQANNFGLAHY